MSKSIMIIDDSASVRRLVGLTLRRANYTVLEGCDGQDALTQLIGQKIHLIITDLNMPNLDGIGFLKAMKQLSSYRFTPVIMLTTDGTEEKKRAGQAVGVRAWVVKPFEPDLLLDAVQKLCLP